MMIEETSGPVRTFGTHFVAEMHKRSNPSRLTPRGASRSAVLHGMQVGAARLRCGAAMRKRRPFAGGSPLLRRHCCSSSRHREDRGPRTEDRRPTTEDRRPTTDDRPVRATGSETLGENCYHPLSIVHSDSNPRPLQRARYRSVPAPGRPSAANADSTGNTEKPRFRFFF